MWENTGKLLKHREKEANQKRPTHGVIPFK